MARIEWVPGWYTRIDDAVKDFLEDIAEDVLRDMIRMCPVDSGELRADLDSEVVGKTARIGARSVEHAIWAEEGVGPHIITPTTRKALYWEGAAHPVPKVNHPGYEGSHFMKRALYRRR